MFYVRWSVGGRGGGRKKAADKKGDTKTTRKPRKPKAEEPSAGSGGCKTEGSELAATLDQPVALMQGESVVLHPPKAQPPPPRRMYQAPTNNTDRGLEDSPAVTSTMYTPSYPESSKPKRQRQGSSEAPAVQKAASDSELLNNSSEPQFLPANFATSGVGETNSNFDGPMWPHPTGQPPYLNGEQWVSGMSVRQLFSQEEWSMFEQQTTEVEKDTLLVEGNTMQKLFTTVHNDDCDCCGGSPGMCHSSPETAHKDFCPRKAKRSVDGKTQQLIQAVWFPPPAKMPSPPSNKCPPPIRRTSSSNSARRPSSVVPASAGRQQPAPKRKYATNNFTGEGKPLGKPLCTNSGSYMNGLQPEGGVTSGGWVPPGSRRQPEIPMDLMETLSGGREMMWEGTLTGSADCEMGYSLQTLGNSEDSLGDLDKLDMSDIVDVFSSSAADNTWARAPETKYTPPLWGGCPEADSDIASELNYSNCNSDTLSHEDMASLFLDLEEEQHGDPDVTNNSGAFDAFDAETDLNSIEDVLELCELNRTSIAVH